MRITDLVGMDRSDFMLLVLKQEAALDAAETREAAMVAAFKLIGPALVGYDGSKTVWCTPCDREIGPIPACCADCPHGEHCPLALYDALTASPAPGGVAGEAGQR